MMEFKDWLKKVYALTPKVLLEQSIGFQNRVKTHWEEYKEACEDEQKNYYV